MAWPTGGRGRMAAIFFVAVLWLGLLLGVSFLATPAKFLAPSLALPVALDVGRHTFALFNKVEWLLAATLLVLALTARRQEAVLLGAAIAALLVIVETAWLLPALDRRVGLIIAGQVPPPSILHDLYIALAIVKLAALGVVAFAIGRRLARPA